MTTRTIFIDNVSAAAVETPVVTPDIETLIRAEFGSDSERALKIAMCESRLDPSRVGDTHMKYWSYGLFQINQTWHKYPVEVLLDPVQNIKIAHDIFLKGGWGRWTCNSLI